MLAPSPATPPAEMEALVPKRPCCACEATRGPFSPTAAAAEAMTPGAFGNPKSTDLLLEALLGGPGWEVELSVERLVESRVCDSEKDRAVDGAVRLGEALLSAAKRCARRLATRHNSASWPLPPDLTIKVFSLLDTQSVCHAAATCSMFNKCANDPLCYANVDLTSEVPKVNNAIVCTMVQRAGKNLRCQSSRADDSDEEDDDATDDSDEEDDDVVDDFDEEDDDAADDFDEEHGDATDDFDEEDDDAADDFDEEDSDATDDFDEEDDDAADDFDEEDDDAAEEDYVLRTPHAPHSPHAQPRPYSEMFTQLTSDIHAQFDCLGEMISSRFDAMEHQVGLIQPQLDSLRNSYSEVRNDMHLINTRFEKLENLYRSMAETQDVIHDAQIALRQDFDTLTRAHQYLWNTYARPPPPSSSGLPPSSIDPPPPPSY